MYEDIKTACLYVRFSSHNQTEQSIEGQTRVCRDFCKRHNIRIVEIYADRATSASKDIEKRVQFLKMIKDSEKGLFDAVIVYKLDRFARSRYDSATYKYRLKRNGVQLISATENISNDPEGIILESVLEGMAEFYSAELSQKINRGMRESAYKHNSIGGAVPLGYKIEDKKLVIDPKTAPIVKEAFEKYADGETVAEICRQFNARGYKTSKGTAFGKSSFTKIFRNERYIGVYTFHDYRAEDAIPAIIDKDLWDRVQLRVGKIKNAPARNKAKVVYLLSGKIFCGHCGSKMNGNCNAGNYCYYQCYGKKNGNVDCKKKNIRKEFIEKLVAQDALSLLTDEYIEQIATIACEKNQHEIELDSALPTIRDRIHQVDLSLNHLLKAIESGSAPDMLVKRMGELEKEKKDLQVQAKKESEDIVELDKAQVIYWLEQFRGGSIEDEEFCRMLIDLFVNSVTVWDEDDNTYKVTVAYNLTSLPTKTYRLNKGGTLSDFTSNAPEAQRQGVGPGMQHGDRHGIRSGRRGQAFVLHRAVMPGHSLIGDIGVRRGDAQRWDGAARGGCGGRGAVKDGGNAAVRAAQCDAQLGGNGDLALVADLGLDPDIRRGVVQIKIPAVDIEALGLQIGVERQRQIDIGFEKHLHGAGDAADRGIEVVAVPEKGDAHAVGGDGLLLRKEIAAGDSIGLVGGLGNAERRVAGGGVVGRNGDEVWRIVPHIRSNVKAERRNAGLIVAGQRAVYIEVAGLAQPLKRKQHLVVFVPRRNGEDVAVEGCRAALAAAAVLNAVTEQILIIEGVGQRDGLPAGFPVVGLVKGVPLGVPVGVNGLCHGEGICPQKVPAVVEIKAFALQCRHSVFSLSDVLYTVAGPRSYLYHTRCRGKKQVSFDGQKVLNARCSDKC